MSEEGTPHTCSSFKDSFSKASDDVDISSSIPYSQASDGVEEPSGETLSRASDGIEESSSEPLCQASGDADESFCEPCRNMGKYVAVAGFCKDCPEYLCNHCLKVHKNQKMTRSHKILDKDHMPVGQGSDINLDSHQDPCVEVCETHSPELIKFFCQDHDEPVCRDCIALKHQNCQRNRVQDVSDGFTATKYFELIQQNLAKVHKQLEVMKETLDSNLKNMDTIYNEIQHKITSFRKQINDYLDQIQKQITEQAAEMKEKYDTEMKKVIAQNGAMKSELEDLLTRIQNVNMNSVFVISKQAKKRLAKMEKELTKMEESKQELQQQHCVFRPSIEIENLVSTNTPLGKLLQKPHINTTASYKGTIDVKIMKGIDDVHINDCTLLGPGRLVVTTNEYNDNIKLIVLRNKTGYSSYCNTTSATISAPPWAVTVVSTDKVAVTVPDERKIQLFNVTTTFSKHCEIQLDHVCQGVAYADGKFAVTYKCPGCIEIMDIQGHVLHTIQPKKGIEEKLRGPQYIIFGSNKNTVIASYDSTNKVRVLTFEGQILFTYTHDLLIAPCGLVMTPDGVLFACSSWKNGSIHSISPDFKTSKVIINKVQHEGALTCITYCDTSHKLYVSKISPQSASEDKQGKHNKIIVYDLNV